MDNNIIVFNRQLSMTIPKESLEEYLLQLTEIIKSLILLFILLYIYGVAKRVAHCHFGCNFLFFFEPRGSLTSIEIPNYFC